MKKIIMMLTLFMGLVVSVKAQTAIVDNGTVKDNWYVGGGLGTNVWNDANSWTLFNTKSKVNDGVNTNSWWRTQPLHANVNIGKMFSPYLGCEIGYMGIFNLNGQSAFIDGHNLTGNIVMNLSNIISGYKGMYRKVEFELLGGAGWVHNFNENVTEVNTMSVCGGLRTNVIVGKGLVMTITPEYVWQPKNVGDAIFSRQGVNISFGVKYYIPSKRGGFPMRKLYDQTEVDNLKSQIANQNTDIANLTKTNVDLSETIKKLIEENKKVIVNTNTQSVGTVHFNKGESEANTNDIANVVKILQNTETNIILTGTTSPEGSEDINKVLGANRVMAVKKALVASGINEKRIVVKDNYEDKRSVIITLE